MLSILIPTYNYPIGPLVNQLHKQAQSLSIPYEILVREDGSSKHLSENKSDCQLPQVHYSRADTNHGRTKTRQWLATQAQYNQVLFLDADVLPAHDQFLMSYLAQYEARADVIFGGITYSEECPAADKSLRWTFGLRREARNASIRNKHPYYVISQNLWIQKDLFLKLNRFEREGYGLDNIFSYRLREAQANIVHIDNPVVHHGIETNEIFLEKSLNAIETLVHYESKGAISEDFTRLQAGYQKLRKAGSLWIFLTVFRTFKSVIERNLLSSQPKMSWFDLYRLYHYAKLKRIERA